MKAASLGYARATSLDEVFALWREAGGDARLIAGGQSLVASLNLRLADVPALIDINHVEALSGVTDCGDVVRIGALTRHRDLLVSPLLAEHAPLLPQAARQIAHPAIRTRGSVGGSLAYADPAAELPACMVALDATLVLLGDDGAERRVGAEDFFLGLFETALRPFEMIVAVEVPKRPSGGRQRLIELSRRSGDYALVGVAACAADAALARTRIVFFGVGEKAVLAAGACRAASEGADEAALHGALMEDIDPMSDMNGTAEFKRHLAGVLLRRVLADLRSDEWRGTAQ
ncbi:FAD binding domain-containing protein [Aurantimonas endophytica]|uniref:Carbon-monoxide dehydrogenase medium subunit n=1 Tax=Aurantimonas endophytica TaxID=1522175 RepID=A0A7W6HGJ0_9HYPH|nr:xanthine dehydrogenase family protein subunit M [Aurantimonas endophytica]MBB4004806.1 carbon-monoxide dehydrogenase medium subunit [Aurantimonas endophytica]MCO6405616.1 xanthine dehydrogenase family protein subunit M [Aurantimonas endophytica]